MVYHIMELVLKYVSYCKKLYYCSPYCWLHSHEKVFILEVIHFWYSFLYDTRNCVNFGKNHQWNFWKMYVGVFSLFQSEKSILLLTNKGFIYHSTLFDVEQCWVRLPGFLCMYMLIMLIFCFIFLDILQRLLEDVLMLQYPEGHHSVKPSLICRCMCFPCYFILGLICRLIQYWWQKSWE